MVLGASHHDLELAELDRLSAGADLLTAELSALVADPDSPITGAVRVATCNRLELYVEADRFHDAIDALLDAVAKATGATADQVGAQVKVRVGAPVAAHLFTVSAGLDSMVVGEAEISGQVARAFSQAQAAGTVSPHLHALFRAAARTAKKVAAGPPNSAMPAGRWPPLRSRSPRPAWTVRWPGPARWSSVPVPMPGSSWPRSVSRAASTCWCTPRPAGRPRSPPRTTLSRCPPTTSALRCAGSIWWCPVAVPPGECWTRRPSRPPWPDRGQPLPILDLALRPDVTDAVRALPGVRIIDLHTVAVQADPAHAGALTTAQDLVIEAVAAFEDELTVRQMDPAVIALRSHVAEAVDRELVRLRAKYEPAVAQDVAQAMHRVTQSLLHTPTMRAHELARSGDSEDYLRALHTLFGIEIRSEG